MTVNGKKEASLVICTLWDIHLVVGLWILCEDTVSLIYLVDGWIRQIEWYLKYFVFVFCYVLISETLHIFLFVKNETIKTTWNDPQQTESQMKEFHKVFWICTQSSMITADCRYSLLESSRIIIPYFLLHCDFSAWNGIIIP